MSSLPHLHVYLEHVSTISTGVPLPVTRSLLKTLRTLTKPLYRRSSFRPVDIVTALSSNRRIISR
jgi:ubiquitin carboxyl-terminal hydrolase 1